jgi:GH15 family glucan-1,4-alpha-glucosidase
MQPDQHRSDGYMPIRDYAAIGDGRTVALVASDGAVDWLCLPDLDSPSLFGALLDAERGGSFALRPDEPFETARRYLPATNVLETTFSTGSGAVRVTDALTLPRSGLSPYRELVRRVDALAGTVPLAWCVEPRFDYGAAPTEVGLRGGVPVATYSRDAVSVSTWDAGDPNVGASEIRGRFQLAQGRSALLVLGCAHQEPLVLPSREEAEARLDATAQVWRDWVAARTYDGPWRDAVLRSALALKLLVFAPSGAIAAAPTTSLPERIGGDRNWDYRFSWPRDASFTVDALLALGADAEAKAFVYWILHATQLTHPEVNVLYRLDGGTTTGENPVPLAGYRDSRPVREGNLAASQMQLDVYGELLDATARFAAAEEKLDGDTAARVAKISDLVCKLWREPDAGIWEVRGPPEHHVHSKMMCAVALSRACALADQGHVPDKRLARWRQEHERIRAFVDELGWSEEKQSYVGVAGSDELDASVLLGVLAGFDEPRTPRLLSTVDAIRRELGRGPLLYRYVTDGDEGAFLACSFWLADAYARQGRVDDAGELMDELVALANDVGLFPEEVDPATGDFLGNFPQGLPHVALINAATSVEEAQR